MTGFCRRLPHFHALGTPIFVTFRLHGSLPAGRSFPQKLESGAAFVAMDRLLDEAAHGPKHLMQPGIAQMVADAIERGAQSDFELHEWVLMANHVHLLVTPHVPFSDAMRRLKGSTAREGNRMLGIDGVSFWQRESYDRLVRDAEEFRRIGRYIVMNPVKAGLVHDAADFLWSSTRARLRREERD